MESEDVFLIDKMAARERLCVVAYIYQAAAEATGEDSVELMELASAILSGAHDPELEARMLRDS